MRLLADENVPQPSVDALVAAGHDVISVAREARGSSDRDVLERSRSDRRLLLTLDRDFGELVFRQGEPAHPGILYCRFVPRTPREVADALLAVVASGVEFEGYFTVLDRDYLRQRRLPEQQPSS